MPPLTGRRVAFTLIELLVVVSIMAMIVTILLPALGESRRQAVSIACKSNVRQLGVGMTMYHHEFGMFPGHQWIFKGPPEVRVRWFNAMAKMLSGYAVQGCPGVSDWSVGRNNSYGYNYKYLGRARDNSTGPKAPFESFPVKSVRSPGRTIAFGDSDGTGWKKPYTPGVNDPEMLGNHGYTLDPTFIPTYSLTTYSDGVLEPYAWKNRRTYVSVRHSGGANLCFADGNVERLKPKQVCANNMYWNGLGAEDPARDPHVPYRHLDGEWRFPDL